MNGKEKKAKAANDPIHYPQYNNIYIFQYKIQSIVPNTFTNNKESVAQEASLHNQSIDNFYLLPLNCRGGVIN